MLFFEKMKGTRVLVLNALQREKHLSHFNLQEALAVAAKVGAEQTYLIHIGHRLGQHKQVEKELPNSVALATLDVTATKCCATSCCDAP